MTPAAKAYRLKPTHLYCFWLPCVPSHNPNLLATNFNPIISLALAMRCRPLSDAAPKDKALAKSSTAAGDGLPACTSIDLQNSSQRVQDDRCFERVEPSRSINRKRRSSPDRCGIAASTSLSPRKDCGLGSPSSRSPTWKRDRRTSRRISAATQANKKETQNKVQSCQQLSKHT